MRACLGKGQEQPEGRIRGNNRIVVNKTGEKEANFGAEGPGKALDPDPSSKATLWVKAQHEGALPPPCIVRKDPRVPHTARRGA